MAKLKTTCNRTLVHLATFTSVAITSAAISSVAILSAAILSAAICSEAMALTQVEVDALVKEVDTRQRNSGDYTSRVFIDQKEKNAPPKSFEAQVYRRDADDKWMILFLKPKAEAGKGYLRVEKNLFLYEPSVGKWERQTERASIAGTGSRRDDFDESRLAEEYTSVFVATEKIGKFEAHRVKLTAKAGVDVASPIVEIWVDKATGNMLKRQDFALSNRMLRTTYYPAWDKMKSPSKGADVYVPREIRTFDEVEKGNSTTILIRDVVLEKLDANIFTKAWIESKSR
jgi:hypothetical protein